MYNQPMNLKEVLGGNVVEVHPAAKQFPNSYGLEVELEGRHVRDAPPEIQAYWAMHDDGSLRILKDGAQTCEYVSRMPYDIKELEKTIEILFTWLKTPPREVFDSYRTSIHVHVNFAAEEMRVIFNFITLSLILDELLVSQNGDHRIGNNFCLRSKDALGQVETLIRSITRHGNIYDLHQADRYSSINFAALMKFGSIEFRSLECTMHEGRLLHWINTLARIKEVSKKFANPIEIIQQFSVLSSTPFLKFVLGPYALKYLSVPKVETMLHNGMRIAQDFAYASEWKEWDPRMTSKASRLGYGKYGKKYHEPQPYDVDDGWGPDPN